MLVDFTRVTNIFIVCGRTDMRKGIDGLASIVQYEYSNNRLFDILQFHILRAPYIALIPVIIASFLFQCL